MKLITEPLNSSEFHGIPSGQQTPSLDGPKLARDKFTYLRL